MALDISVISGIVSVYRTVEDDFGQPSFSSYPVGDFVKYKFTSDSFEFRIGADIYECLFPDLTVGGDSPYDFDEANTLLSAVLNPCCETVTGASGTFLSDDALTVTVVNGIITEITGGA